MEIWLEPVGPGTVVHWYLRVDPARPRVARSPRRVRRERERRVRAWKSDMYALKDRLDEVEFQLASLMGQSRRESSFVKTTTADTLPRS